MITLNAIRKHDPCERSWKHLLKSMGKTEADDTPVSLIYILDLLGLGDALWALRCLPEEFESPVRLLACDFAESALKYTDDPRPAEVIRVARLYAVGQATEKDLAAAREAALAAAWGALWAALWDAAGAAVWAAAREAALAAAGGASWAALWDAAGDARDAGDAARDAGDAAKLKQEEIFRKWLDDNNLGE